METVACQLAPGTLLQGARHTFVIDKLLGKGGFGMTYRGRETVSGREVAIKEYFPDMCQPCRMQNGCIVPLTQYQQAYSHGKKSFLNEAAMLKALDDVPSVVRILEYFETNGTAYMVMEYINGSTLRSLVETGGPIPVQALMPRMLPLMQDLSVIHERGVLHRDIAPDNIIWMPDGKLKLLDFGCARATEDGRSMTVQLKPGFAPLEQYQTRGQGDYTDVYALCASIYYCITGLVPISSPERVMTLNNGEPDPLPWPSTLGIEIQTELEQLLMWGLTVYPNARPQTMGELTGRIEKLPPAKTSKGSDSIPKEPVEPTPKPEPKQDWLRWVIIGLCAAAGLAVLVSVLHIL